MYSISSSQSGVNGPSIEDSMAMVAVALGLYGLIKIVSWTFSSGNYNRFELRYTKKYVEAVKLQCEFGSFELIWILCVNLMLDLFLPL